MKNERIDMDVDKSKDRTKTQSNRHFTPSLNAKNSSYVSLPLQVHSNHQPARK